MSNVPNRIGCDTYAADLRIMTDEEVTKRREIEPDFVEARHRIYITIARDETGRPMELAFSGRGKIGSGMDQMLVNLGVIVSRAIQDRDPTTGDVL